MILHSIPFTLRHDKDEKAQVSETKSLDYFLELTKGQNLQKKKKGWGGVNDEVDRGRKPLHGYANQMARIWKVSTTWPVPMLFHKTYKL